MNEPQKPVQPPPHAAPDDTGSRALSEALRSSFAIVKIVMVLLVIVFFGSGVFTVPSQEQAIVLRFGKPVGTGAEQLLGPGLHWSFPYPIDEVVRIPIGNTLAVTSRAGWYETTPEAEATNSEPPPNMTLNPATDGYTLTSDGNIIHVRATVQYRIVDPLNYVLNFVSASNVVLNAVDNALFYASSQFDANRAVREDQQGFQEVLLQRVRTLLDAYKLGIVVEAAVVKTIPPRQLKDAFERVTSSEIERRKTRDDAQAYAARTLSTAQGEASRVVNAGQTEATRLLQQVSSEARYFTNLLASFQSNSTLFQERLQAEAMGRVLARAQNKVYTLPPTRAGDKPEVRVLLNPPQRTRKPPADMDGGQH